MEKIYDKKKIEDHLFRSHLWEQFDTQGLDFALFRYQCGEFLSGPQRPVTHFLFLVRGSAALYYLDENGIRRNVTILDGAGLLGDMEFVLGSMPIFYIEAITPVTALALPMEKNRENLEKDCRFLMYLLRQASQIKIFTARNAVVMPRLEERLIYYLRSGCPHQTLTGMDNTAARLQCSRRQLQRVVKKLEGEGRLVKVGKGCYRLTEK